MKTLDEIFDNQHLGVDVLTLPGNANSERVISARGNYYLGGDISTAMTNAIEITARL